MTEEDMTEEDFAEALKTRIDELLKMAPKTADVVAVGVAVIYMTEDDRTRMAADAIVHSSYMKQKDLIFANFAEAFSSRQHTEPRVTRTRRGTIVRFRSPRRKL